MAVMVWPYRWIIDPPLEVNVPSKRTPWPDAPPELPTNENVVLGIQEHAVKHPTKTAHLDQRDEARESMTQERWDTGCFKAF
nr:beta-1,4-xylosyltransferase IRX14-like [Ziziphus jujuba var. spinosa]